MADETAPSSGPIDPFALIQPANAQRSPGLIRDRAPRSLRLALPRVSPLQEQLFCLQQSAVPLRTVRITDYVYGRMVHVGYLARRGKKFLREAQRVFFHTTKQRAQQICAMAPEIINLRCCHSADEVSC